MPKNYCTALYVQEYFMSQHTSNPLLMATRSVVVQQVVVPQASVQYLVTSNLHWIDRINYFYFSQQNISIIQRTIHPYPMRPFSLAEMISTVFRTVQGFKFDSPDLQKKICLEKARNKKLFFFNFSSKSLSKMDNFACYMSDCWATSC